jgi:hypothetical protein
MKTGAFAPNPQASMLCANAKTIQWKMSQSTFFAKGSQGRTSI